MKWFVRLLLLFILVPSVELFLLGRLSAHPRIGFWEIALLIVVTGVIGAVAARWQGLKAFRRVREDLEQGRLPAQSLLEGVAVLLGCALLVTPGVITDVVGLLLFVPPVRRLVATQVKKSLKKKLERAIQTGRVYVNGRPIDEFDAR